MFRGRKTVAAAPARQASPQVPKLSTLGTSPGRYQPIIPTFIVGWHPERLRVQLAFGVIVGASAQAALPTAPERRYALREVKARLHQASFRDAVLTAYGSRYAISLLPEPRLLDAAHIIVDTDVELGQPVVSNGLPLSKIHHAAFDAHLIGIDPDFRIYVADRLLEIHDGPFLELGLKTIRGERIALPRRADYPDRTKTRSSSSLKCPSRATRTGGTMIPSWKISSQSGDSAPARMPPISLKCAQD
jgi:putative restriction endonuclease